MSTTEHAPWNHNINYHGLLLDAIGPNPGHVLDVGCGEGHLTGELAARAERVTGIEPDPPTFELAYHRLAGLTNVELIRDDVLVHDFGDQRFDAVVGIAVLHHLPLEDGLRRLSSLVQPGGVLGIVGLARSRSPRDYAYDGAGFFATRASRLRHHYTEINAPVIDPTETYAEVRATAERLLPGVRFRRHVLFRYSLVWAAPG